MVSQFICTTFTLSYITDHCLNSVQELSFIFAPHIHLIILMSDLCNTSSFSLFLIITRGAIRV